MIHFFILASNPFFEAYTQSDFLGRLIVLSLILISIITWIILIQKTFLTRNSHKLSLEFQNLFQHQKMNPLNVDFPKIPTKSSINPFFDLYLILKKQCIDMLNKNRRFGQSDKQHADGTSYLSPSDIDCIQSIMMTSISFQVKKLESNLYILSTIVSLAPFLGLLGTVWGILTTFSELQSQVGGSSHQMVLGGLSLALATTVMGLINAIPALIGYNYLKNIIKDFEIDMEGFSNEMLISVELQYRQVDVK
jgi:biopolymer transport protein TolQ